LFQRTYHYNLVKLFASHAVALRLLRPLWLVDWLIDKEKYSNSYLNVNFSYFFTFVIIFDDMNWNGIKNENVLCYIYIACNFNSFSPWNPFSEMHECGIKMRSKLTYRKVEFQNFSPDSHFRGRGRTRAPSNIQTCPRLLWRALGPTAGHAEWVINQSQKSNLKMISVIIVLYLASHSYQNSQKE